MQNLTVVVNIIKLKSKKLKYISHLLSFLVCKELYLYKHDRKKERAKYVFKK